MFQGLTWYNRNEEQGLSENEIIEMRRKKREALMRQLEFHKPETLDNTAAEVDTRDIESGAKTNTDAADNDSAVNYDEMIDSDVQRFSKVTPVSEVEETHSDSESDDMFADSPVQPKSKAKKSGKQLDSSLLDNWDDVDGYYRIIPNELINGQYHVSTFLGKGMFASVVRAQDSSSNKTVAIKIVRNNETMFKAGLTELSILQKLNDRDPEDKMHIVRLLTNFEHKNHLCLVFENLECNLRDVLKKFGRNVGINIMAIRSYTRQLLLGLSLMRECGVLHADLKPDNVLVDSSHKVLKICDLGSASVSGENEITPYLVSRFYRAPELILGLQYGHPIDMWSIGCSLFELYTGKILFPGNSNNEMLRMIMETLGKFNHKMLKKGQFADQHFDDKFDFISTGQVDKVTGNSVSKVIKNVGPLPDRTIKARLAGAEGEGINEKTKLLAQFIDLLEKMLLTNPEKRITPLEGLKHPFVKL